MHASYVRRVIFGYSLVKRQRIGTRYEVARLKRTHFPIIAPSYSTGSLMRFTREPTSFPPEGYARHASSTPFRKPRSVPILLIVATCLLCARPDILLWIQVWRITWPLRQTREPNFGKRESPAIEKPTKQDSKSKKLLKS